MRGIATQHLSARARAEGGFTLVEVLAAVAVMAIGLFATVGLFDDSRDQNATGERAEIALLQAEQAIEELRGLPYDKLMLDSGAVDPTGGDRVVNAGSDFRVAPEQTEPLVFYTSEGATQGDAWVSPTTEVSIGSDAAPLDLTVHRFVTWRDEECRVADLGEIGADLPGAIGTTGGLVTGVVNTITGALLQLLNPTLRNLTNQLRNRLDSLNSRLTSVASALANVTELDLCDADLSVLQEVQKLDRLGAELPVLDTTLGALQNALGLCLPLVCNQTQVQSAVNQARAQLNCMFESSGMSGDATYLDGVLAGIDDLANDFSDTAKNSKRITVAVTVEPRNGVAPIRPVWMSSVVRDPTAGLLTSGGASCL